MRSIRQRLGNAMLRSIAKSLLPVSTVRARVALRKNAPLRILVDNSVLGHGITHETAWIDAGPEKWGPFEVQMGNAARIPVHSPQNDGRVYREVRFLAGIAELVHSGHLELYSSAELEAERFRQPIGRFAGYGWFDFNVFKGMPIHSIDGYHLDISDSKETQLKRVASCDDPLFLLLLDALGPKSSLDAYHILTAEKHGLYCFLHIDFPLAKKVEQNHGKPPFCNLQTRVLLPSQFARLIGLMPVDTNLLTLADRNFPERPDLHWDDQMRERPRKDA